jgi:sugar (pentulose or hexulose) kinase
MVNKQPAILIFDIGKTTKKVLLFDMNFHTLEEKTVHFQEAKDEDGFPCENLTVLTQWVLEMVNHYLSQPEFLITHVNFSAYGASLVHLSNGHVVSPFYNYLKPFPEDCKTNFLGTYDDKNSLLVSTASPYLGLLNSGLQLYWLKHKKPQLFRSIDTSLHFPQYFTYLLSKEKFTDITSVGCHTMLWDFAKSDYHDWVDKEQLRHLFPKIYSADHTTSYNQNGTEVTIGVGVHDSSAALMPYLAVMKEKFLLLSTGTWNICFNPFNAELLADNELSQDCLCFLTYDGQPVKASRIFLGHEHELQQLALAKHFHVDPQFYTTIEFDRGLFQRLKQSDGFKSFAPLGMEGTGPRLDSPPLFTDYDTFANFAEAQHHLIRQLVRWQKVSIDLVDPAAEIKKLIVVGGFTKSKLFLEILKSELPERTIMVSDHPRAAALGAAWLVCGKEAYASKTDLLNLSAI